MSKDHLVPRSKGGKGKRNIVLAHRICNEKRSDKPPTNDMLNRARAIWNQVHKFPIAEVQRFSRERTAVWVRFDFPINVGEPKFDPAEWRKKHGLKP